MAHYQHPMATHPLRGASVRAADTGLVGGEDADHEEGRLLAGPAFWIGGLLSLAAWVALAAAFGLV
jgi:hypothetical protein